MTFILVILTFGVILSIEFVSRSRKKLPDANPELVAEHPNSIEFFDRCFHPGHTWAMISGANDITVGSDDFATGMIGRITKIDMPEKGNTIHQGETFAVLHHYQRRLAQVAPISGTIVEVNTKLKEDPSLLNASPMNHGWIARIAPTHLETEIRNLLKGFSADGWRDAVRAQLIHLFTPRIGTMMQDGGQLVKDLGDNITDDQWNRLVKEFFPIILPTERRTNQRTEESIS